MATRSELLVKSGRKLFDDIQKNRPDAKLGIGVGEMISSIGRRSNVLMSAANGANALPLLCQTRRNSA